MAQTEIDLSKLESELKAQAKHYVKQLQGHTFENHNSQSILLRLTGMRFCDLENPAQLEAATNAVKNALATEAKRSRMGRYNYDPNRHIALHQALKSLKLLQSQCDDKTDIAELCAIKKAGETPALNLREKMF